MKKNDFVTILGALDQTRRIKWAVENGDVFLPAMKLGKEVELYKVGQLVTSNGTGPTKAGISAVVTETYKQNGYWYYVTDTMGTVRNKDIV